MSSDSLGKEKLELLSVIMGGKAKVSDLEEKMCERSDIAIALKDALTSET